MFRVLRRSATGDVHRVEQNIGLSWRECALWAEDRTTHGIKGERKEKKTKEKEKTKTKTKTKAWWSDAAGPSSDWSFTRGLGSGSEEMVIKPWPARFMFYFYLFLFIFFIFFVLPFLGFHMYVFVSCFSLDRSHHLTMMRLTHLCNHTSK